MIVLALLIVALILCVLAAFPIQTTWHGGLFPLGVAFAILALIVEHWPK